MKITAEPRSDQWNADDFIGGPRTFTIAGVKPGNAEQKYDIELVEGGGRAWRPPLTVLRVLLAAWGNEAADWVGKRVTLYRDEKVRFGNDAVGGIRVSHMSALPTGGQPFAVKVTTTRGRRTNYTVQPLTDTSQQTTRTAEPTAEQVAACASPDELRAMWPHAGEERRAQIKARVAELNASPEGADATEPTDHDTVDTTTGEVLPDGDFAEPPSDFWDQQDGGQQP